MIWRTGGLAPGYWLARKTPDLSAPPPGAPVRPLPTIPFPTPAPTAARTAAPRGGTEGPSPSPVFADFSLGNDPIKLPVEGSRVGDLKDSFLDARGSATRHHEAIDIPAPRGTPVVAAVDGKVARLFTSRQGGLTVYQFDKAENYSYYYAHLDRYDEKLKEGMMLRKGDRIGYVGTTGNAPPDTPHLHFAIFRLNPEKRWWEGMAIDPYPLLMQSR